MVGKKKRFKKEVKKDLEETGSEHGSKEEKTSNPQKALETSKETVEENSKNILQEKPSKDKKSDMDREEDFLFKVLVAAFLVVLVFLVYSVATQKPVYYSQLYFNEQSLPGEVDANSSFSFSFVIENHEKEACQYLYMLTINNETSDLFTYMVPSEVEQGDRIEQNIKMALGPSDEPVKVGIKVPTPSSDEPLEIHFWVDVVDEASEN